MLKDQILKFNELLSKQATLMRQSGLTAIASLPVSNGSHISPIYRNSRCHIADNVGASTNPEEMQSSVPTNLPTAYGSCGPCGSTLHPCIQPVGNMSAQNGNKVEVNPNMLLAQPSSMGMAQNGNKVDVNPNMLLAQSVGMTQNGNKVDVNPNMLLAQPSNVGMTSAMNGNLIKLEPSYDNRSPFDFGTHGNLFESCSAMGDTPTSFSSVESNTQHHCDALYDGDSSWIRQTFGFDLAADFSNSSDLLENSYNRPPFLANNTGNLLDSNGNIEQFNNSSGLRYEGFSSD
ncbi:PREDICTED: uncharacterized protein LOC109152331 isoform X2 [Ipomoea nil]|nr:PREDICTED: uncharacterized protein LOC109152331 isoform X2 [Ipomoea nil]